MMTNLGVSSLHRYVEKFCPTSYVEALWISHFFLLWVSCLEDFVALLEVCLLKSLRVAASIRKISLYRDEFFPINNQVAYYRVVFRSSLQASFKSFPCDRCCRLNLWEIRFVIIVLSHQRFSMIFSKTFFFIITLEKSQTVGVEWI